MTVQLLNLKKKTGSRSQYKKILRVYCPGDLFALHIEEAPVARPLISEDQICKSGGYKEQDQHYDRYNIADHKAV